MIAVYDCETTGVDPEVDRVVELAIITLEDNGDFRDCASWLVNPGRPIPPEARAVHHLSDRDVADAGTLANTLFKASCLLAPTGSHVFAAHNAAFDGPFLSMEIEICTWRCARHLWPEAPAYGNQVLRYWLDGLEDELVENTMALKSRLPEVFASVMRPHRALGDAWVSAHVLRRMLRERTPAQLVKLTKEPILIKKLHFGMHRNKPLEEVPRDYLQWLRRQPDLDADLKYSLDHYLKLPQPVAVRAPRETSYT